MLVDPGDRVVYPVPSWNNNYYRSSSAREQVTVICGAGDELSSDGRHARVRTSADARLLVLNSPLNPTGTLSRRRDVERICDLVARGERGAASEPGERPLFLLYDQVYWMLTFGDARMSTRSRSSARCEPYTIFVDAISKSFAATGLRVGWAVGPADVDQADVGHPRARRRVGAARRAGGDGASAER